MTSEDVLHAYFIPAFRTKTDLVPGRYTMSWFTPTKTGEFHLFCAEYCGTQHSGMIGKIIVMEPADYQAWLRGVPRGAPPAEAGQKFFTDLACNNCHLNQDGGRGPTLTGLFGTEVKLDNGSVVKADETYLRESILRPGEKIVAGYQNDMPTFQGLVTEEQVAMIIAYIKSIGPNRPGGSAASSANQATPASAPATTPTPQAAKPGAAPKSNQPTQKR
jgi:cytochrome c oxidase subunit 2